MRVLSRPRSGRQTLAATSAVSPPDPRGGGRARWITRWKPALDAFAATFEAAIEIDDEPTGRRQLHR